MLVTLLGTGCPQCDPARLGPASLVRAMAMSFLIDCGSGVTQRLVGANSSGASLDAVLLTHLHSDHVVDLYQLIVSSWHQGRDRPQRIFGPRGTRAFADGMMKVWRTEREARIRYEARPSAVAFDLDVVEIEEGIVFDQAGLRISAFAVDHGPVRPAFGFLFETAGCRVAFSGDTTVCDNLVRRASGVDLLVHECFIHGEMAPTAMRSATTLANVAAYHTLSSEVGKVASRAGAGMLVLNHFVPVAFDRDALLAEVRADYTGPIVVGEDLLSIDAERRTIMFEGLRLGLGREGAGSPSAGRGPQSR